MTVIRQYDAWGAACTDSIVVPGGVGTATAAHEVVVAAEAAGCVTVVSRSGTAAAKRRLLIGCLGMGLSGRWSLRGNGRGAAAGPAPVG
ncbi:hypothetical protein GCM10017567_53220 [Amycolatopsis bullii]|uniref:Uncharacterized protein n=1 Tax=Amycolatopsis bullii TaxID=941987 RepID=A0ABQ3KI61_9PSEU|nr:hypothetical protein GCM10017567_53220 [Amycolatopsis bullii]